MRDLNGIFAVNGDREIVRRGACSRVSQRLAAAGRNGYGGNADAARLCIGSERAQDKCHGGENFEHAA